MDALECFFDVRWIQSDQRILPDLGTMNGLGLDFVDSTFAAFLRSRGCRYDSSRKRQLLREQIEFSSS